MMVEGAPQMGSARRALECQLPRFHPGRSKDRLRQGAAVEGPDQCVLVGVPICQCWSHTHSVSLSKGDKISVPSGESLNLVTPN